MSVSHWLLLAEPLAVLTDSRRRVVPLRSIGSFDTRVRAGSSGSQWQTPPVAQIHVPSTDGETHDTSQMTMHQLEVEDDSNCNDAKDGSPEQHPTETSLAVVIGQLLFVLHHGLLKRPRGEMLFHLVLCSDERQGHVVTVTSDDLCHSNVVLANEFSNFFFVLSNGGSESRALSVHGRVDDAFHSWLKDLGERLEECLNVLSGADARRFC